MPTPQERRALRNRLDDALALLREQGWTNANIDAAFTGMYLEDMVERAEQLASPDIRDTEYDRDNGEGLVSSGGECVGCHRIMSVRERNEQGVCDGCAEGSDR